MPSTGHKRGHPFLAFLLLSLCGGLVMAGMAVPGLFLTVGATNLAATNMQNLPQELVTPPQPEGSTVYLADGSVLANFAEQNRTYVPLSEIAPVMQQAQVAIEDRRFFQHGAVDLQGLVRAVFVQLMGGQQQGASTLTQQYVKLVREQIATASHDPAALAAAQDDTISRKITEMRYAIALEQELSKNEILERYLNLAYYGDGCYGVEAAAMYYYGVHAKDLTLPQAAMLAGLVQNPSITDPVNHLSAALTRRAAVLDAMVQVGDITAAQAADAKQAGYDATQKVSFDNGCASARAGYQFICNYVYAVLTSDQMPGLGSNPDARATELKQGGLQIHTLINPAIQDAVQAAVSAKVAPTDSVISAVAQVQPGTGDIVAMAQSRTWGYNQAAGETNWNYVVNGDMGGAEGFQAGSTFKIFTLAVAMQQGAPFNTVYRAPSPIQLKGWKSQTCSGPWTFPQSQLIQNVNNTGYGEINLLYATVNSVNTYFLQLEADVGICNVVRMAQSTGMVLAQPSNGSTDLLAGANADHFPVFTLGTFGVSPLNVAESYATFASGGIHCNSIILQSVIGNDGKEIPVPQANCQQVMDPRVASGVDYALVQTGQSGSVSQFRVPGGYPQAMKTGTTNGVVTEWVAGYTPELATAAVVSADTSKSSPLNVWGWNSDGSSKATLTGYTAKSGTRYTGSSGHDAGQVWGPAMTAGLVGKPQTPFPAYTPMPDTFKGSYTPAPRVTPTPTTAAPATSAAAPPAHAPASTVVIPPILGTKPAQPGEHG